ncbi:hypothetical protein [Methanoregula sp.]|uniref:hypothetical protein n=1 Tax=Methanoregula sp. TaxID=2052170 RepID=UPI000CAECBEF|nr:hypothetical protein [Methanoregula sp.]PKG32826.1 MAG: hypothetical protein CW742_06125 [Methanoregula sp.]
MNAKTRYAVFFLLVVALLVALALTIPSPLLYTLEEDSFPSPFHQNTDVLKHLATNSTDDIVPEIQEFVDFTGPLSLSIRVHDVEQARRDFERFQNSHGSLKNLIVKLDMNESEIQELERNTALQKEILDTLLNTTISLDELQVMEIQYHSENNQDMLTTIRLRGEELRKKVRGMGARYQNATERVAESGRKLGINMTKNQESQSTVNQIIERIEHPEAEALLRVDTSLVPGDDRISLFLRPDTGKYREVIEYMGISLSLQGNVTRREGGKQIILYMDDVPFSTVTTDSFGYYNTKIPLERVISGTHTVYSRSPTSRSVNRTLTVEQVPSATTLSVSHTNRSTIVNCSGAVMANFPVRSASVEIVWDETHVLVTKTDSRGWFMKEIELPPGRHTILARFNGAGYPIDPSASAPQVIEISLIPRTGDELELWDILLVICAIAILAGFVKITLYYIQRMTRKIEARAEKTGEVPAGTSGSLEDSDSDLPARPADTSELMDPDNETIIAYYSRLLEEKGLKAASWRVYQQLAARVARDQEIRRHRTLTAREISRSCKGKPYCRPFARFIAVYERIRYGGIVSVKDQTVFETALHTTDEQMEGGRH